jgi:predicted ester cyclase
MRATFPDLHIDVDNIVVQDDSVALCMDIHGTHKGAGLGIAPTGRKVHVRGMIILQVSGGKVTGAHNIWDQHGLLRQLGISPKAEAESKDRFFGDAMPGA